MAGAFQRTAFQASAFQVDRTTAAVGPGEGGGGHTLKAWNHDEWEQIRRAKRARPSTGTTTLGTLAAREPGADHLRGTGRVTTTATGRLREAGADSARGSGGPITLGSGAAHEGAELQRLRHEVEDLEAVLLFLQMRNA